MKLFIKTELFFSRMFGLFISLIKIIYQPTCPYQTTKFSVGLWKQILTRMAKRTYILQVLVIFSCAIPEKSYNVMMAQ